MGKGSVSLAYLQEISSICNNKDFESFALARIINFKDLMNELVEFVEDKELAQIPAPPVLTQTCTSTNCVCAMYNRPSCSEYNICIKCYRCFDDCKCNL